MGFEFGAVEGRRESRGRMWSLLAHLAMEDWQFERENER